MTARTRSQFALWLLILVAILIVVVGGQLNRAINNDAKIVSALKEAKQWQQVIDDSDTAFIVFDNNYEIIQWSRGAQLLLGWSESEAVGAKIQLIIPTERYKQGVWSGQNLKQAIYKTIETDCYVENKNGKLLNANIRLVAVINNQILYVIQIVKLEQLESFSGTEGIGFDLAEPYKVEQFRTKK